MKLVSMTAYVLEQDKISLPLLTTNWNKQFKNIVNYAKFLSMPLELKMFVPCVDGEVFNYSLHGNKEDFERAKSEVIFEGFEYKEAKQESHYSLIRFPDRNITPLYPKLWEGMTIEDLVKFNITLTEKATI